MAKDSPFPSFTDLVTQLINIARAINNLSAVVTNSFVSLAANNTFTGANSFTQPVQLAAYAVASLPAVTLTNVGSVAFATNGRNTGEGGGSGTGCLVQVQNKSGTATWCAVWSGVQITS